MISETVYDNAPTPKSSDTSSVEESLASPTQSVANSDTELMQTPMPDFTSTPVDDKKKDESKKGMGKWLARAAKDRASGLKKNKRGKRDAWKGLRRIDTMFQPSRDMIVAPYTTSIKYWSM